MALNTDGIKLGIQRPPTPIRPPARSNKGGRPYNCGRAPESDNSAPFSLLLSAFPPFLACLFPLLPCSRFSRQGLLSEKAWPFAKISREILFWEPFIIKKLVLRYFELVLWEQNSLLRLKKGLCTWTSVLAFGAASPRPCKGRGFAAVGCGRHLSSLSPPLQGEGLGVGSVSSFYVLTTPVYTS